MGEVATTLKAFEQQLHKALTSVPRVGVPQNVSVVSILKHRRT